MKRILLSLLVLALSAPAGEGPAPKPKAAPPPERVTVEITDPELKKDIDECIRKGVAWLKGRQLPDGSWPGLDQGTAYNGGQGPTYDDKTELTALALLALLKCDVRPSDSSIVRGFAWLKKMWTAKNPIPNYCAYTYGILLMAIEAKYIPKEVVVKPGQKTPPPAPLQVSADDQTWARQLASLIVSKQAMPGGWRYSDVINDMADGKPGLSDVSATQYALMGLKTARRMGVPVDIKVFNRAADWLMTQQDKDGKVVTRITERSGKDDEEESSDVNYGKDRCRGFAYMRGYRDEKHARASASMTCAGIIGLLICRSELLEFKTTLVDERKRRLDAMQQSIFDGLAWLDANWSVTENRPNQDYELGYTLYALERVGVMADLRRIGPDHDWFMEGARVWTSSMKDVDKDKGYWAIGQCRQKPETQETPYGLLFLRKAAIKIGYPIGEE